jgi:hypothetical protein
MSSATTPSRLLGAVLLVAAGLLAGCASRSPAMLGDDEVLAGEIASARNLGDLSPDRLANRSLAVKTGPTPSFYADTPGRRTFGLLGVIAMMRQGNQLVETYNLEDPAAYLSQDLVATLATRNSMRTDTRDHADLLLDVKTINWDFRPYRNDPESLFVVYSARVSLVDQRDGAVLASGKCRSRRDSQGDSATLDQLLADGAKRLQSELREAAYECAQRVKEQTLSVFLQNVPPVAQGSLEPRRTPPLR